MRGHGRSAAARPAEEPRYVRLSAPRYAHAQAVPRCLKPLPSCVVSARQVPVPSDGVGIWLVAGSEEEYDVSHSAFHRAFEDAKPAPAKVPGLQEFAAAIYERRRLIASSHDPLMQIFDEVGAGGWMHAAPTMHSACLLHGPPRSATPTSSCTHGHLHLAGDLVPAFNSRAHTVAGRILSA